MSERTWRVEVVVRVDAQMGEGGGQVTRAAAPAEGRVTGLVRVQRGGQR